MNSVCEFKFCRRQAGRKASWIFYGGLLWAALLGGGCATIPPPRALWNLTAKAPGPDEERTAFNRSVYDNVGDWVESYYYDAKFNGADWPAARESHRAAALAAKNEDELYAAINALLGELKDRHTYAQSAGDFARSFWNRNIVLGWRSLTDAGATDGRRRIVEVFPGSPAAEAGVQEGWILLSCDGRPPGEVLGAGKLKQGQAVRCDFLTASGEARTLSITGRPMNVPTYRRIREAAEGVFVLRFDQFDDASARWVREQVKAHAAAKALIFDLRGNPGGHVFALTSILDDVFPKAVDMGTDVHRGRPALWPRWILHSGGAHYNGKIAVLVSGSTGSAAEMFSQLVQENHRGLVVGQKSAGALLTTVFWPLAGGGRLWLTVYDYRSPGGTRVEGRGVLPDVKVESTTLGGATGENDPVVTAAVEALRGGAGGAVPAAAGNF